MNNWILFSIGVVLGILVSVSVIQNDLVGRLFGQTTPEPSLHTSNIDIIDAINAKLPSTSNEIQTIKEQSMKDETVKIVSQPSVIATKEAETAGSVTVTVKNNAPTKEITEPVSILPVSTSTDQQVKKPVIKWAPGKEMNFQKYIEHAETAQKHIFGEEAGKLATPKNDETLRSSANDQPAPRKKGNKRGKEGGGLAGGKRRPTQLNESELPIELQNQLKLYKKLKKKEGMFVGDNDEDPTAAIVNAADEESNGGKKGGKRKKGAKVDDVPPISYVTAPLNITSITLTNGNGQPPIAYHGQVQIDYTNYKPLQISYDEAAKLGRPLPDMTRQKGGFEKENLKLHLCNGVFEAYSASYLTTKEHMLAVASESYNLSWVNCEMASFIHMKESNRFYKSPNHHGVIMQSLDVLDFSVIHLSAFERSSLKHKNVIWSDERDRRKHWSNIDPVIEAGKRLEALNNPQKRPKTRKTINYSPEAKDTVVVMPFLGGAMGAGHSKLNNRFEYLKTCFWSLYEFFPNIVISVTRQDDVNWGWKDSGLPFYDIILITNLPKSASLPVATTQQTKNRLKSGQWNFSYVFFSESDQILISRELSLMYQHLKRYPGHMMLPHRLMPYSSLAITKAHKRDISTLKENEWMSQSCCMPRQNCVERQSWKSVRDPVVPMINYYGLYVPLGNINFLREEYRYCTLSPYIGDYCP